ncbi:MAG TPA: glycosyltransferase [Candidatus Competibacter sp.]|nr:glycosyltransferase [Candidatus Competibacter sp.]HRX62814.1 glycosyltransferase [Candidatus Competibacter sp.]
MVKHWRIQPAFHLVVWCELAQQSALADTLESIGQQLYDRWGVSVLAPFDCPDDSFAELTNIEWVKIEANADTTLRNILEESALGWFALLEPGDRLAPYALLKAADYINRYPAWRFIYLDEDQLDARGERRDPIFRPEFDPELLLGTHYLGDCCLMHRESVLADSDLAYLPGLTTFQAALRVFEDHGRSAVGHIADVLYHRTLARSQAADAATIAQARRQLVEDHLARRGIDVAVKEALLPGAWRLVYRHPVQPKVSIIILARDALDRLDRCLRRLLGKTVYPDYEVLVVDCGSEVDDTLDLYAELEARQPGQFQVIPAQGPFSAPAYWNQGACQTKGEVLVFLSASALVVQPQWIERLLNHALRDEIGIVGARMTTPDRANPFVHGTAQVLGMRGVVGPLFTGLPLKAPGPFGRAQVDQAVSAVSAECLAIRREVFEELEGFDERFVIAHADTDLCLRAAERGYRTVWTPFANLAWLGEYPLATGFSHDERVKHSRADAERMFERWLPKLAADPTYNPNLSLAEPHRIEVELAPGWDTIFRDRPRLLGIPVDESGCGLYRVYAPLWLLEHQARAECTLIKPGTRLPELAEMERLAPDTVFYQSTVGDLGLAAMRLYRRFHKSFKVFDLDDLKHDVPDANSLKERLIRDMKYRHRMALRECDRLTVSTEPLAEIYRQWISDIRVVPNRLERARWGHLQNRRRVGPKPRVGWAGAQQHHGDLAFITDVVKQIYDEVDWVFFGMCLDELRPYVKEVHDWVHLNNYPAKLASMDLDLAVAPLEYHPFNEAKSNLRILEHGILGRPMVCTDIYPYRNAPVKRVPNETSAWVEAIRERVHDLDAAEQEGDMLRAWVLEHYILDNHTDEWLDALRP